MNGKQREELSVYAEISDVFRLAVGAYLLKPPEEWRIVKGPL